MLASLDVCDDIKTFANGKLAIDHIKKSLEEGKPLPEVIFLDINMPIMDGWQFLEEFITLPIEKKIRVNIITSSIDPFDLRNSEIYKAKTHHPIAFNNKPIRKKEIEEITKAA